MKPQRLDRIFFILAFCFFNCGPAAAADDPMRISIDARDLHRKLIEAEVIIPITSRNEPQSVPLWYPKWVPGSHGPGGPVANIAGLKIETAGGDLLDWKRTPGEVYRIEVEVPAGEEELHVAIRYVTDQPTTTSFGHDCFSSNKIGVISPSCLLLYPEGISIDKQMIVSEVHLPEDWVAATALPKAGGSESSPGVQSYDPVSLRTFVDSPIMIGRHYRPYELAVDSELSPPHTLHVFADDDDSTEINEDVVTNYGKMVQQTSRLIGSHPFGRFDILLGVTDALPKNGLEHARSTFNVLPPRSLASPAALKGWDRLLVPHEYLHAWCGKYRRPAGMLTTDFHTPKDTELLWVYEGLTQYLGELIEARSGIMSAEEFKHRLLVELRNATHQQGRRWRTLADTAAASHILRSGSRAWGGLRRSQDYYMEGMLFWLEADARIRKLTDGEKSLDDFCRRFFKAGKGNNDPIAYDREDIVKHLNAVAKFDWDGLISRRVESFQQQFDPEVAGLLGYKFELTDSKPKIPANTFRHTSGVDLLDSLGMVVGSDGTIKRVLLDSPADRAQLSPNMKIIAIGDQTWSPSRLQSALKQTTNNQPIELLTTLGPNITPIQIQYYDGPRYWGLGENLDRTLLIEEILGER